MKCSFSQLWKTCGAAVLGGTLVAGAAQADPPRVKVLQLGGDGQLIQIGGDKNDDAQEGGIVVGGAPGVVTAEATAIKLSDYWLGVQAGPVDPLALAQLKLDHGLAVMHVADDSPAGKAGVKVHDILLSFGDAELKEVPQLIEALDTNKDKEVTVKVLREGKETTVKVTPAKRPEGAAKAEVAPLPGGAPPEVAKWFEGIQRGEGRGPVRMFFAHPGAIVGHATASAKAQEFPSDLSVSVEKNGDKPANVKVKKGDKSWEVTQDKIDELPEDVRPFVNQLLNNQQGEFNVRVDGSPNVFFREFRGAAPENMQKQFDELHRMLDQLQQQVGDLPNAEPMKKEMQELRKQNQERRGERQEKRSNDKEEKSESKAETKA